MAPKKEKKSVSLKKEKKVLTAEGWKKKVHKK